MVLGLQPLSEGTGGSGVPSLDSAAGEEILYIHPDDVVVAVGRHPPESPGTLFFSTKRVMWLNFADKRKGYAVDLSSICVREVSLFWDHELDLLCCISIQIKTEDDESANSEDSNSEGAENIQLSKITFMRLWTTDLSQLDSILDIFRQYLNPEPNEAVAVEPGYVFGYHHLSETVRKVEELIEGLSSTPGDVSMTDIAQVEKCPIINDISLQHVENETTIRYIHGIAREISLLKLSMSRAKAMFEKNHLFIENLESRIQNATSLLEVSLKHCFVKGLEHRDASSLYTCLCAYAYINNMSAAEEIFRTTTVAPLVKKIIPFDGASSDELEEDFRQMKHCIEKDCNFLLEISSTDDLGLHVFDFGANSILKEVLLAIDKGKPRAFFPDRLMVFLNNYNSSLHFLAFLEGYCPSESDVDKHQSDIMRRLNVGNYFSHSLQKIARVLDSALGDYAITRYDKKKRKTLKFLSRQSKFLISRMVIHKMEDVRTNSTSSKWIITDDIKDFIYVFRDVHSLLCGVLFLHTELRDDCVGDISVRDHVIRSLLRAKSSLEECLPAIIDTIIEAIVKKSVEVLRHLKWITKEFKYRRFTCDAKLPEVHSPYVSCLLQQLETFVDGVDIEILNHGTIHQILFGAAKRITSCYCEVAAYVVSVVRQVKVREVEESPDAVERITSSANWILTQLILDLQEYKKKLELDLSNLVRKKLGLDLKIVVDEVPEYQSLYDCVLTLL